MTIALLQVSASSLAYMCLGGFIVLFSMVSLLVKEELYINEVVLGTGFGVIIGPHVANVFDPRSWGGLQENKITLEIMRVVLATGLFSVGVELPCAYMRRHAKSLCIMVVPTMALGWVIVSAILVALFPGLNQVSALCVAACLTPTDPVTCAAITRGRFASKHVPVEIRRILSAESAANDGLAYPFLSIAIYLTVESSVRAAIWKWFLVGCLYQVVLGAILGALMGLLFSKLMQLSHRRGYIDRESFVAQYLALSIFTIGVASSIGVDDLLASFAAGCAISWDGHFGVQTADDSFSSIIDYVLNCGCFIYIGAWLPFQSYNSPELGITPWRLVVLMVAILILRRIPSLFLLYRWVPEIGSWREALFSGHFGPMGVSAIFVSVVAHTRLPVPAHPPANQAELLAAVIQPIVSFIVLGSIIIHGLSIPFFNLGRGVRSRTAPLSLTWTRTRTLGTLPDWVLYANRPENGLGIPTAPVTNDVERGTATNGLANPEAKARRDQRGHGLPSASGTVVDEKAVETISKCISGSEDESVELEEAVEKVNPDSFTPDGTPLQFKRARSPPNCKE